MNGDREIRDLLRARANDIPPSGAIPSPVLRRSRRRRALTASVVSVALVMAGAGALAGVQAVADRSRIPPAEEGPSRTERTDDDGSSERRGSAVVDSSQMALVEAASGRHPDGYGWSLQVGRAGNEYCAELVPQDATTCWSRNMMSDRFPLDVYMQGNSSEDQFQFLVGFADADVARVEMRLSKRSTHDKLGLQQAPMGLNTDGRFFAAFPPTRSAGSLVAFDSTNDEVGSVRFTRARRAGDANCEGTQDADLVQSPGPLLPFGALGPMELFAASFTALWSAGATECGSAAQYSPARKVEGTNR